MKIVLMLAAILLLALAAYGYSGWHDASRDSPASNEDQFIALVATLISPGKFNPAHRNAAFETRVTRIRKLVAGQCQPTGHGDVQLEGCR